jgi:DNA modification methylase
MDRPVEIFTLRARAICGLGYKMHPARFPVALPDFFMRLLTDADDLVLDPFAGSNITGSVAEGFGCNSVAIPGTQYLILVPSPCL